VFKKIIANKKFNTHLYDATFSSRTHHIKILTLTKRLYVNYYTRNYYLLQKLKTVMNLFSFTEFAISTYEKKKKQKSKSI